MLSYKELPKRYERKKEIVTFLENYSHLPLEKNPEKLSKVQAQGIDFATITMFFKRVTESFETMYINWNNQNVTWNK